jgi:hypothetical protein
MIGRPLRRGEQFDTDALIGKVYHIMVSNTPEDERGRVYDNVENVHRVRPKAGEEPDERRNGPREEEEGFNDAPW